MSNLCPRIWVGCLAAYNAGTLHGTWLDVNDHMSADDLHDAIKAQVLETSPEPGAEEWHIADYEGFGEVGIDRYENLETVFQYAQAIEQHGDVAAIAISHWPAEWEKAIEAYAGCYERPGEYAEQLAGDCYGTNNLGPLANYIDYETFERDMDMSGDIHVIEVSWRERHVFHTF